MIWFTSCYKCATFQPICVCYFGFQDFIGGFALSYSWSLESFLSDTFPRKAGYFFTARLSLLVWRTYLTMNCTIKAFYFNFIFYFIFLFFIFIWISSWSFVAVMGKHLWKSVKEVTCPLRSPCKLCWWLHDRKVLIQIFRGNIGTKNWRKRTKKSEWQVI